MNEKSKNKLKIMESLEIPIWIQRPKQAHLFFLKPRAYARIWVVLSKELQRTAHKAYTIYKGMLNVLEIPEEEFSYAVVQNTANIIVNNDFYINMINTLNRFSPENILILGKDLGEHWQKLLPLVHKENAANVFATYHPEELTASPQYKKEAYHCLLSLKENLHNQVKLKEENTGITGEVTK